MASLDTLLACPACASVLRRTTGGLCCDTCPVDYRNENGIDALYAPTDWGDRTRYTDYEDVSGEVRAFYEDKPFPDYDEFDTIESLAAKARKGLFARLLDEQIPLGSRIIEFGSGTSQLSLFLSARGRSVLAADMCLNSLRLGQQFAQANRLDDVQFAQMNLLQPAVAQGAFDLVICNGVLHHTCDTRAGFESIARAVRPGGYIVFGLYHYWGRLITDTRRLIFRHSGGRFTFLDPNLRSQVNSAAKKAAWFNDQYQHPHETKHTIRECLGWLPPAGFQFVRSIPGTHLFKPFKADESLFARSEPASGLEALAKEMSLFFSGSQEGGFFIIIARKTA